ncbi:GPI-anchor transamidase, partial [Candida viswanathii]
MKNFFSYVLPILALLGAVLSSEEVLQENTQQPLQQQEQKPSRHSNNWAVLVSTSRFWFNYRHMANALSLYRTVKRLGIPDSQIILMLNGLYNMDEAIDLYGESIEVDYRGYEVTVDNFMRLLTDRWDSDQPRSKRLLTDENSNIFIYLTGHGGNEFLKFQDAEEIGAYDLKDAFNVMHEQKRYNEIFFMIDTCQANTIDMDIGVAVIDRFTYYTLDYLERIDRDSKETMDKLTDLFKRNINDVLLTDFFGNVQNVVVDDVDSELLKKVEQDEAASGINKTKQTMMRERGPL